ncbi:MAG: ABC transporter ATP-binding protein [Clostridia bacterium]
MHAIEIKELTKKYKGKSAVSKLDLSIEQGELFALLGVNGAGKTTTIKMLSGLSKPTSGHINILGKDLEANLQYIKKKMNVSPQETAVAANLTARENLELIAKIYGSDAKEAKEKADRMLSSLSLKEVEKSKSKTLSGGMQRRLSIAMALISDPEILYLDEPTLGLDVLARRELWRFIEKLKGKMTIILTTHYMEEAESLSDRIGIMAEGELKAVGTVKELMEQTGTDKFEDAFVSIASQVAE